MDITGLFSMLEPKIGEGTKFCWECFGGNAWSIDIGERAHVIYDLKTQRIYQVIFYDYEEGYKFEKPAIAYVWTDLQYKHLYLDERKERNITDDNLFTETYVDSTEIFKRIRIHQDEKLD